MNLSEAKEKLKCGQDCYDYGKDAAVLIPFVEDEKGQMEILFEVRSGKLKYQPGEICFPGGKMEAGENAEEAAVRETCEELLIKKENIEILTPVRQVIAPRGGTLWCTAGLLKNYRNTFSEEEVGNILRIPLDFLMEYEPLVKVCQMATIPEEDFPFELIPNGKNYKWSVRTRRMLFYQYEGYVIWGTTATVLEQVLWRMGKERK